MKLLIKKAKDFVGEGVWEKKEDDFPSRKGWWLVRQVRLILYTARGVKEHNTVVRSAALTFFTLMSLVPILALAFGVIKGFGLETALEDYLYEHFSENGQFIRSALGFVNEVLLRTSGGLVAVSGLAVLVWAAARVFGNVENAFNTIWEVKTSRSITRRASTYAAVIFIMPLLTVLLAVVLSYVRNLIANYSSIPNNILYAAGSFAVLWLMLAGAYKAIPNTRVKFRYAALAGVIAAVAFSVFQLVYIALQSGVSSYNIIYGSFAAIPLFLLWIQVSWQIVLFGAELSFSYQNIESFLQEHYAVNVNYDNRRKVMLASMLVITRSFLRGEGGITSEAISKELKLPVRLVRDVSYALSEADLIVAISSDKSKSEKTKLYIPVKDVHEMRILDVLHAVENAGTSIKKVSDHYYLHHLFALLEQMDKKVAESDDNLLLVDLLKHEDHDNR